MERKKASDFPQELLDEFHLYVHGDIDRRTFLDRAGKYAVGGLTAAAIFELLKPNYAWAQQVPRRTTADQGRVRDRAVPARQRLDQGLSCPAGEGAPESCRSILVVHENRGLNPYVEDVARRLATANFMAFAPDGLTSVGGYPGDDEKGGELFGKVDRAKMTEDFVAAATWLKARAESTGRIGVTGFCFGGGIANTLAVRMGADLAAAAPYYGGAPAAADVPKIKAAVLVHHGELDTRLVEAWPAYEAALKANKVRTRATSIRRPITASTTTRRRVTTKRRPSSRGRARSPGSTSTCARRNNSNPL